MKIFLSLYLIVIFGCTPDSNYDGNDSIKNKAFGDSIIDIGTFNIAWLGDREDDKITRSTDDYKSIAEVINNLDVDILALQEIENESALNELMPFLPGYKYAFVDTESEQDNAFLYKESIEINSVREYSPVNVLVGRTRPGLLISVTINEQELAILSVHFKSTSRYDDTHEKRLLSYELRKKQSMAVSNFIDSMKVQEVENFIVVGDMNDNPKRKNSNIKSINERLTFITTDMPSCKNPDWDMIDHIALSSGMQEKYLKNSVFVYNFYSSLKYDDAKIISDHCPVTASFRMGEI